MFRGAAKTLDIALLLILFIVALLIGLMLMLPEPPPAPAPADTPTTTVTPTVTPTFTPIPPRTPRSTSTLTVTPSPTPTATPVYLTPTPRPTAPAGSTATPLPLVAASVPLPRSGLFIRRHNDFGPPSTAGIATLVRDGLAIGEEQIVLPAIEPFDGVRIPGPREDESAGALALRYGLVRIPLAEPRDPDATHYLEIALKAGDIAAGTAAGTAAPTVNYIFVVDTSGSMAGAKLRGAQDAMRALYAEMRPQDTIGIIDFDNQTRVVLPATPVADLTLSQLNRALGQLVALGGTDVNLGLLAGVEEAARYAQADTLSHAFLFSDGEATDGVTEWLEIRRNLVVAVGDANIRVSTFAFGEDANARELDALAGVTGGTYAFVDDPTAVGGTLAAELARRDRLAGKDIRLTLTLDEGVEARALFGHDQVGMPIGRAALDAGEAENLQPVQITGTDAGGLRVIIPDIAAGEAYWIVLEVAVPAEHAPADKAIGDVELTYVDTATARAVRTTESLTFGASWAKLPEVLVLHHAIGAWTSDVAFYALDDVLQDDLATATARLTAHLAALEAAYPDVTTVWLQEDIETVRTLTTLAAALEEGSLPRATGTGATRLLQYGLDALGRAQSGAAELGE